MYPHLLACTRGRSFSKHFCKPHHRLRTLGLRFFLPPKSLCMLGLKSVSQSNHPCKRDCPSWELPTLHPLHHPSRRAFLLQYQPCAFPRPNHQVSSQLGRQSWTRLTNQPVSRLLDLISPWV